MEHTKEYLAQKYLRPLFFEQIKEGKKLDEEIKRNLESMGFKI